MKATPFFMEETTMRDDTASVLFRIKLSNIKEIINVLLDKGIITSEVYVEFLIRILETKTFEGLSQIAHDIAELCKKPSKP